MAKNITTYNQFIDLIANYANVKRKDVKSIMEIQRAVLATELANGNKVVFLKTFIAEIKHYKSRNGVNPKTGEKLVISDSDRVVFKPSSSLKKDVNHLIKDSIDLYE